MFYRQKKQKKRAELRIELRFPASGSGVLPWCEQGIPAASCLGKYQVAHVPTPVTPDYTIQLKKKCGTRGVIRKRNRSLYIIEEGRRRTIREELLTRGVVAADPLPSCWIRQWRSWMIIVEGDVRWICVRGK